MARTHSADEDSTLSSSSSSSLDAQEQPAQQGRAPLRLSRSSVDSQRYLPRRTVFTRAHDYIWRWYMWSIAVTPGSMFQVWERWVLLTIIFTVSALLWWSIWFHLPMHLYQIGQKGRYYLFGTQSFATAAQQASDKGSWTASDWQQAIQTAASTIDHHEL